MFKPRFNPSMNPYVQMPSQMPQQQMGMMQPQFGMPPQQFGMEPQFSMPPQQFGMEPQFEMHQQPFNMPHQPIQNLQHGMPTQHHNLMLTQLMTIVEPAVHYGIRQSRILGVPNSMKLVAVMAYLMGKGYDFQAALRYAESIELEEQMIR